MICPICNKEMAATTNPNIFKCKPQEAWCPNIRNESGPKIQTHLNTAHSIIFSDDTGTISIFEVPPYIITIYNTKDTEPKTVISERVSRQRGQEVLIEDLEILRLSSAVDLPWHDSDQVIERIKTYLLFS